MGATSNARRIVGAPVIALGAWSTAVCETPSASSASFTPSTRYSCWLDDVVLDTTMRCVICAEAVAPGCD